MYTPRQTQAVVLLTLALCVLAALRLAPPRPLPGPEPLGSYIYEVRGAVRAPGFYRFAVPQTAAALVEAAGGATVVSGQGLSCLQVLPGATRVVAGAQMRCEPFSARARMAFFLPLCVNTASARDLDLLPGIGPGLARAIIAYRRRCGRIASLQELLAVRGIGRRRLEMLRPWLCL